MKRIAKMFIILFCGIILFFSNNCQAESTYGGFAVAGIIEIPSIQVRYPVLKEVSKNRTRTCSLFPLWSWIK